VDLAKRDSPCDELGALAVAPGAARPGVEDDRRGGSHQTSVDATRVAAALNIPPRPWQIDSRQPGPWPARHSPRSWRAAAMSERRAASKRAKSGIWLTITCVDASPVPST